MNPAEHFRREAVIQARWELDKQTPRRWQTIRDAYSLQLPHILSTGCSPYFLQWDFTPIEALAWQDIRGMGLRLYPQFPALQYFIDFADPILQIGVELDGKEFHSADKDMRRDETLWEQGWRIFRIPGRESLPAPADPRFDNLIDTAEPDDAYRVYAEWGQRWSTGFFWALAVAYYGRKVKDESLISAAYRILNSHRLVQFPLELEETE